MAYGSVGTDGSANAPSLYANLLVTFAVNLQRHGFSVQNQSANPIQVVLDDGQGGTPTIYICDPGIAANRQGADWSLAQAGILHLGRIRIFALNATDQIAAREY